MTISEDQLQTWSKQGAITTAKLTHESIRNALNTGTLSQGVSYDIYLQGSYKNDTNIRGDSDVDIIVELTSVYYSNLTEEQKHALGWTPASYSWNDFMRDVLDRLIAYYGSTQITRGNKCINLAPNSGRLPADIIVCAKYKYYENLVVIAEGITFWTRDNGLQIVGYPKLHTDLCITKNIQTDGRFKPSVRMFKNARTYLVSHSIIDNSLAPSYLLESLLYSVPSSYFRRDFQNTYCDVLNWLLKADFNTLTFPSFKQALFGSDNDQWSIDKVRKLLDKLVSLWNNP